MKKMLKKIPEFATEQEEVNFWNRHDITDYFDFNNGNKSIFPNLKPSTETISLRLPESLLHGIKNIANMNDIPYQSLIKIMLADRVQELSEKRYARFQPVRKKSPQRAVRLRRATQGRAQSVE